MTNEEFRTEAPALLKQWSEVSEQIIITEDTPRMDLFCLGWCLGKGMTSQQAMNFRVKTIIGA